MIRRSHGRLVKMLWSFCVSIVVCLVVANTQPISCQEDTHCSEGYFCDTQENVCQECLRCNDHKRESPKRDTCIKSISSCGPCSNGFINIYGKGIKGKCVLPNYFEFGITYAFVWMIAAFLSILIVAGFVYVIGHTKVFKIVAYYNRVPGTTPLAGAVIPATAPSPRHLLKYIMNFEKSPVNK